jgi:hypothetical protein
MECAHRVYTPGVQSPLFEGLPRRTKTMMAWILVSLLSSFMGDAVVAFSPETNVATPYALDGSPYPPKP